MNTQVCLVSIEEIEAEIDGLILFNRLHLLMKSHHQLSCLPTHKQRYLTLAEPIQYLLWSTNGMSSVSLPVDILPQILECATRMQPWHAHVFSVVSKGTQMAVEKIIYESLLLTSHDRSRARWTWRHDFPQTAVVEKILPRFRNRPTNFFAATVKNVLVDEYASDDRDAIELVLTKCTGIRILAYWMYDPIKAGPWILNSAHTLECFWVTGDVFEEALANCQVVLPALEKMHLCDLHENWEEHVEFVISIAPNLQYILLRGRYWYQEDIEEWMEGRSDTYTIEFQDDSSNTEDDVDFLDEWLLTISSNI